MPPDPPLKKLDTDKSLVWIDGTLVDPESGGIPAFDPGFLCGTGIFETLAYRNGHPLCLAMHYQRLRAGAESFGILPPAIETLHGAITRCVSANSLQEARVRITVTGDPLTSLAGSVTISARPLMVPSGPASAVIVPFRRNPHSPLAGLKSTSYAESILALRHARSQGADEAILCDTTGNLSEAATANLFYVVSGCVRTPPVTTGCLPGITRRLVLDLCEKNGLPHAVELSPPRSLRDATEAFLTSSIRGVQPLGSIGHPFPSAPGPITSRIKSMLEALLNTTPDPPLIGE